MTSPRDLLAAVRRHPRLAPEPEIGLYAQGVVFGAGAHRRLVRAEEDVRGLVAPGSRIDRAAHGDGAADADAGEDDHLRAAARSEQDLRARVDAAVAGPWRDFARECVADVHVLTHALPAPVAGWNPHWRYVWPRDAAHTLALLADLGRTDDVIRGLGFLAEHQRPDGWFEARYTPAGGVPDARPRQSDGNGWFLWVLEHCVRTLPGAEERLREAVGQAPARAASTILADLSPATGLPSPSPDYWEVGEDRLTLGTAAPLLAGLQAASRLPATFGVGRTVRPAARRLEGAIREEFGPWGYRRYARPFAGYDAALLFLLPPYVSGFEEEAGSRLDQAWWAMRRPAGGVAPGADWKDRHISWTPQTALFAQASAALGAAGRAARILHWIARHRTALGAIPEKIRADGSPAAVAPLAWSASVALTTLVRGRVAPPRVPVPGTAVSGGGSA